MGSCRSLLTFQDFKGLSAVFSWIDLVRSTLDLEFRNTFYFSRCRLLRVLLNRRLSSYLSDSYCDVQENFVIIVDNVNSMLSRFRNKRLGELASCIISLPAIVSQFSVSITAWLKNELVVA